LIIMHFKSVILVFALLCVVAVSAASSSKGEDKVSKELMKQLEKYENKAVASSKTNKQVEKPKKAAARKEEKNKKKAKKDTIYLWLKQYITSYESKLKRQEKKEQERKRREAHKILSSPTLDKIANEKLSNVTTSEYNFDMYKVDDSWTGYFKSFFGYPTKYKLNPDNVLTKALIQSGNYKTRVETDNNGHSYLAISDRS